MAFVLVARMTAREGEEDRAAELIPPACRGLRAGPGNVHYIAHRDPEDPRVFLMYEQYRDKAAFEEHGADRALPDPRRRPSSSPAWRTASATSTRRSTRGRGGAARRSRR